MSTLSSPKRRPIFTFSATSSWYTSPPSLVMFVGTCTQWRPKRPMFWFNLTKKSFKESKPLGTQTKCSRLRMPSIPPILALLSGRNDQRSAPSQKVAEKSIEPSVVQEEGLSQTWPPFYFPFHPSVRELYRSDFLPIYSDTDLVKSDRWYSDQPNKKGRGTPRFTPGNRLEHRQRLHRVCLW
jgi:hypothetical protein